MGVLDTSRQPLSKHLAKGCQMLGQARLTVNPSAFMRARSVRLYACSADPTFHKNRPRFQEELFDVLAPILGCPEVRRKAATGIYGGTLPSWWKDIEETANDTAATEKSKENDSVVGNEKAKADDPMSQASNAVPRLRCRYGAECRRQHPDHRRDYAHPGDSDWDTPVVSTTVVSSDKRLRCRYGDKCYRKGAEHLKEYAHPGDPDWESASAEANDGNDVHPKNDLAATDKPDCVEPPADCTRGNEVSKMDNAKDLNALPTTTTEVRYNTELGKDNTAVCEPCSTENRKTDVVPGLMLWLTELSLPQYFPAADEWAQAEGACCLQEIVDDLEDFLGDIGFKKLECKRIRKDGASAMDVTLSSLQAR